MKRAHYDLKVWQEAMELVKMIYENSSCFPELERIDKFSASTEA